MIHSYYDTLKQVEEVFKAHPQVASVDAGDTLEFDIKKFDQFPKVFIETLTSRYEGRWVYAMQLVVCDLVNNDKNDITDTLNNCHAILVDGVSQLNRLEMLDPGQVSMIPIYNFQDTQVAGWRLDVDILTQLGLECNYDL